MIVSESASRLEDELLRFARALVRQQRKSGSWADDRPSLPSIVVTCQGTQLLTSLSCSHFGGSIARALDWLSQATTVAHEYSYWRALPLIQGEADESTIGAALAHLEEKVTFGLLHHENSPLKPFLLECAVSAGARSAVVDKVVAELAESLASIPPDWPAERVSYRLLAVLLADPVRGAAVAKAAIEHIAARMTGSGAGVHWSSLVATAYICLNLLAASSLITESGLQGRVRDLADRAGEYLASRWESRDFRSEPLAGGDFNETTPSYAQVVVARALVRWQGMRRPHWYHDVWSRAWSLEYRRRRDLMWVSSGLTLLLLARIVPPPVVATIQTQLTEAAWTWTSRLADVVGIGVVVFPFAKRAVRRFRS